jgi:very-short-patch-repair endonuclease
MANESAEATTCSSKPHSRFRQLEASSARRRHLFTIAQAAAAEIPASTIRSRVAAGRVHRVFTGVYSFSPPPYERDRLWLAAVLACGSGSLLSDLPAACLLGCAASALTPHVSVPGERGRELDGIVLHQRRIAEGDRFVRLGIPCTSPARTIVDLATSLPIDALEQILVKADSLRILNRRRLDELVAGRRGRRGSAKLRSLLAGDPIRVRSEAELDFLRLCRRAGIDLPQVNVRVTVGSKTFEVDFCWPDRRIVIEVDGYAFHGGRSRANADRDRDQLLAIAGWLVHRFTADQIRDDPDEVIRRLRVLLSRERWGG